MTIATLRKMGLTVGLLFAANACEATDRCGDGRVDDGEICDDGNRAGSDGCSASCEPDDDASTPGDDRAGYFVCAEPLGLGVTCGPGSVCCLTGGPVCVSAEQGCSDVFNVVSCDGPEDCTHSSEHCETLTHGTSCTPSEGSVTWCHHDRDCVGVFPWLPDGECSITGACDFDPQAP